MPRRERVVEGQGEEEEEVEEEEVEGVGRSDVFGRKTSRIVFVRLGEEREVRRSQTGDV